MTSSESQAGPEPLPDGAPAPAPGAAPADAAPRSDDRAGLRSDDRAEAEAGGDGPPAEPAAPPAAASDGGDSLRKVLGGRGGAIDATVPVVAFVLVWLGVDLADRPHAVTFAAAAALLAAIGVAIFRLAQGKRPRAVLFGLLGVAVAALVAIYTGRAQDFFLVQILTNVASALAWAISIVVRWPLLGLVVGTALGQRTRWQRDPDLLRGYQRASWVWVGQYVVRVAIFVPLYQLEWILALGAARVVLSPALVAACVLLSWPALRSALPAGHPGIRHPRPAGADVRGVTAG